MKDCHMIAWDEIYQNIIPFRKKYTTLTWSEPTLVIRVTAIKLPAGGAKSAIP